MMSSLLDTCLKSWRSCWSHVKWAMESTWCHPCWQLWHPCHAPSLPYGCNGFLLDSEIIFKVLFLTWPLISPCCFTSPLACLDMVYTVALSVSSSLAANGYWKAMFPGTDFDLLCLALLAQFLSLTLSTHSISWIWIFHQTSHPKRCQRYVLMYERLSSVWSRKSRQNSNTQPVIQ